MWAAAPGTAREATMSNLRNMLEMALNAGHNALDMRCDNFELLHQELLRYNDFTSRACYRWIPRSGLTRIDMPHIVVPNTGSFESQTWLGARGPSSVVTECGLPDRMMPFGSNSLMRLASVLNGMISQ